MAIPPGRSPLAIVAVWGPTNWDPRSGRQDRIVNIICAAGSEGSATKNGGQAARPPTHFGVFGIDDGATSDSEAIGFNSGALTWAYPSTLSLPGLPD